MADVERSMSTPPVPDDRARRRSSLQQDRSRASRRALVDAAHRLWSERGADDVKVEEICLEAGLSKGLFYFYFATKEDLLVELTLERGDEIAAAIDAAMARDEPVDEVVRRGLAVAARLAQRTPKHLVVRSIAEWLGAVERHDALGVGHVTHDAAFARAMAYGQDRGELDAGHGADELGATLAWSVLHAELEWARSVRRQPSLMRRMWSRAEIVLRGGGWEPAG